MEAPGRRRRNVQRRCRDMEGLFVVVVEAGQLGQPLFPLVLGSKEVVSHVAQKLDFHDVNLVDGEAGHFGPRLVSVSVVVEDWTLVLAFLLPLCDSSIKSAYIYCQA